VTTILSSRDTASRLDGLHVENTVVRYQARATVFAQGDTCAGVMYIRRGGVKLTVTSRTGRVAVVAILRSGAFFGEGALAGQRRRSCKAETLGATTLAVVKTREMRRRLSDTVMLADWFRSHLLCRHIRTESELIDQLLHRCETRLARVLLLLANFDTHYRQRAPLPAISRNLLADMAGITRPNVDVLMNRFRKLGFIERIDGGVQVHRSLLTIVTQE